MGASSKNCSVCIYSYARSWYAASNSKYYQETMRSWIWSLTSFGLKIGIVLSAGRLVTCWLEQQETGIIQLSPANEMVQLYWLTTLHHWKSYVPVHGTLQTCRGSKEEQQDRARGDYYTRMVITLPWRKTTWALALAYTLNYTSRCRLT